MNNDPIIIIDDDDDDLEIMKQAFAELNIENKILAFHDGHSFLEYMKATEKKAFFIICDINMASISGLELKQRIHDDERLRLKCIPFIFMSTSGASASVMKAYSFGVQGYFIKPNSLTDLKVLQRNIMHYWTFSQKPHA